MGEQPLVGSQINANFAATKIRKTKIKLINTHTLSRPKNEPTTITTSTQLWRHGSRDDDWQNCRWCLLTQRCACHRPSSSGHCIEFQQNLPPKSARRQAKSAKGELLSLSLSLFFSLPTRQTSAERFCGKGASAICAAPAGGLIWRFGVWAANVPLTIRCASAAQLNEPDCLPRSGQWLGRGR